MKKWDEMTPRERDALVAEKVMRWTVGDHPELHGTGQMMVEYEEPVYFKDDGSFICECQWYPNEDISAAWEVAEQFYGYNLEKYGSNQKFQATIYTDNDLFNAWASSAPEAICHAALRAVGVDV